jgi:hypothetical protein
VDAGTASVSSSSVFSVSGSSATLACFSEGGGVDERERDAQEDNDEKVAALGEFSRDVFGVPVQVLTVETDWRICSDPLSWPLGDGDLALVSDSAVSDSAVAGVRMSSFLLETLLRQGGAFEPEDSAILLVTSGSFTGGVSWLIGQPLRLHHGAPALASFVSSLAGVSTGAAAGVLVSMLPPGTNSAALTRHGRRKRKGVKSLVDASSVSGAGAAGVVTGVFDGGSSSEESSEYAPKDIM